MYLKRLNKPFFLLLASVTVLASCERPPVETTQGGYRGTGMVDVQNPRLAKTVEVPDAQPPVPAVGPTAGEIYQNVQVLGDLSVAEFTRTMAAVTEWVSPDEGCNYCHNPANLASDDIYTKVVSRRMFQMTRDINSNWTDHVAQTGVTCYTCHGGQPVPENIWFKDHSEAGASRFAGNRNGQNIAAESVGYTSMVGDPLSNTIASTDVSNVRVLGTNYGPSPDDGATIQDTEAVYGLMLHMSGALGVNCTYCHNSRSFGTWTGSTPQRVTAWHGLNMVRDLNESYLIPLGPEYPENRLGPAGDAPKASCATCHGGLAKPLNGAAMAEAYPGLKPR